MNLDTISSFRGIDLSNCQTRDEKIEKIINSDKAIFEDIFFELTEKEKEKYFTNLTFYYLQKYLSTKSDEFIFSYVADQYRELDSFLLGSIANLIKNENLRYELTAILILHTNCYYINSILETISSDILKMKLINMMIKANASNFLCADAIMLLTDDKHKEIFIHTLQSKHEQVRIIKSFKDVELIKQYALKREYSEFRSTLVAATNDPDFIKKQFMKIKVPIFRNNLINFVQSEKLKLELISLLEDKNVQRFVLSNYDKSYYDYIATLQESDILEERIDDQITIGVELECCNKNIDHYKNIENVLKDFTIKGDASVRSGFEIVSPILHYTKSDMQKLKSVCNLLKKSEFYTDYSCGGHIHIGANYLATVQEMYMLLYLYSNCEHIIYQICNKEHSKVRASINRYAKATKEIYLKASEEGKLDETLTPEEMIDVLLKINETRRNGLNLKNLDNYYKKTIEFRMPNGEIEFEELLLNIKLFTKLVQTAHELANSDIKDERKLQALRLSEHMKEKDRLEIFLNILFDSEKDKQIYRKRYSSNIDFIENIKHELFYRKEELIEIDEESKRLSKKR